jgi:hypothetical protein
MKTKGVFFKFMMSAALGCFLLAVSCHGKEEGVGTTTPTGGEGTASTAVSTAVIKLVRLDGTELGLTSKPIPRAVKIKVSFDQEVASDVRTTIENAFILKRGADSIDRTFMWADDGKSFVATPARWFKYGTSYNVGFDPEILSGAPVTTFITALKHDINGDGYVDIALGAPGFKGDGVYRGNVYVILGSAGGISSRDLSAEGADISITGSTDKERFGGSISIAGDVNADGYADIIIGACGNIADSPAQRGHAYLFLGGPSLSGNVSISSAAASIAGEGANDMFGKSVAIAGDVNGDGYDDVVVGAPHAGMSDHGRIYVYFGSAGGIDTSSAARTTGLEKTLMGWFVSGAGDTNADGYDDIIAGAPAPGGGTVNAYAYVFPGGSDFTLAESAGKKITGPAGSLLGSWVSTAGDVNNNGFGDVIVSAPGMDSQKGRAFVFFGSETGIIDCDMTAATPCVPDLTIKGVVGGGLLNSTSSAGDVNRDGFSDIILGAAGIPGATDYYNGRAYIFHGSGSLSGEKNADSANAVITGKAPSDMLGSLVSTAGDTNGDGIDDILIGAPGVNSAKGEVYVLLGSSSGIGNCDLSAAAPCTPAVTVKGANPNDLLGFGCNLINGNISTASALVLFFSAMMPLALLLTMRKRGL